MDEAVRKKFEAKFKDYLNKELKGKYLCAIVSLGNKEKGPGGQFNFETSSWWVTNTNQETDSFLDLNVLFNAFFNFVQINMPRVGPGTPKVPEPEKRNYG